jgi:hypothetical protein
MQTTARQTVRIAGIVLAGAMGLLAQSAAQPASETLQPSPNVLKSVNTAQPSAQAPADDFLKKALAATSSNFMATQDHSNSGVSSKSWFATGPNTFPSSIRLDPTFGSSISRYGAVPAAVQFSFGKK